jgi:hypothetical protein
MASISTCCSGGEHGSQSLVSSVGEQLDPHPAIDAPRATPPVRKTYQPHEQPLSPLRAALAKLGSHRPVVYSRMATGGVAELDTDS